MSDSLAAITSLSTTSSTQSTTSTYKKIKEDMQALAKALQSGDLTSAQSVFATLQKDAPNLTAESQNANTTNTRAQALSALSASLQSGNLTQAQQDFTALQQAMQGSSSVQGHHHHPHPSTDSSTSQTAATESSSAGDLFSTLAEQDTSSNTISGTGLNTQA